MPQLQIDLSAVLTLGGNDRVDVTSLYEDVTDMQERVVQLDAAATPTTATLWEAANDLPATYKALILCVDPEGEREATHQVDVSITFVSTVINFRWDRRVPLVLPASGCTVGAFPGSPTAPTGNIVKVQARNTLVDTTSTIKVRCVIVK